MLTFRGTDKKFDLQRDLLEMITNKKYKVDLANLSDKKFFSFAKEMYFAEKALGNKSTRHKSLIIFLKSPGILDSASGVSNTTFLSSDPHELCDRIKLLLQKKKLVIILI